MPMEKMGKKTDKEKGVFRNSSVVGEQDDDDTVGFKYEPKADSKLWQPSEGCCKC